MPCYRHVLYRVCESYQCNVYSGTCLWTTEILWTHLDVPMNDSSYSTNENLPLKCRHSCVIRTHFLFQRVSTYIIGVPLYSNAACATTGSPSLWTLLTHQMVSPVQFWCRFQQCMCMCQPHAAQEKLSLLMRRITAIPG